MTVKVMTPVHTATVLAACMVLLMTPTAVPTAAERVPVSAASDSLRGFSIQLPFQIDESGCVEPGDAEVDGFLAPGIQLQGAIGSGDGDAASVEVAEKFRIEYHRTYKVLENLENGETYILQYCGMPEEEAEQAAADRNATVFDTPTPRWSTGLTIPVSFLDKLGVVDRAVLVDATYMTNACMQLAIEDDSDFCAVRHLESYDTGFAGLASALGSALHFTDNFGTGATASPIDVSFDASSDPGMLQRAEWIKFVAAFFNREALAEKIFDTIQERYDATSRRAQAAASEGAGGFPSVAFVQYFAPYPSFGLPESWRIETPGYLDDLVEDAGGRLPASVAAPDTDVLSYANVSDVLEALEGIDYIIDLTYAADPFEYNFTSFLDRFSLDAESDADRFPFLGSGNVFRTDRTLNDGEYNGQYGLDWYEGAIVNPDLVLMDMVKILHPDALDDDDETIWFRRIAGNEVDAHRVVSEDDCDTAWLCKGPPSSVDRAALFVCNGISCGY